MPDHKQSNRSEHADDGQVPGEFRYPYLITARHSRPVPARRDGRNFVCAYPVFLGMWWSPKDVQVLENDPQKDYFADLRQQIRQAAPEIDGRGDRGWERVSPPGLRRPGTRAPHRAPPPSLWRAR